MKECSDQIKELIPLYVDQALSEDEIAIVEEHLKICDSCKEELALYQMMSEELKLDDIVLPDGFHSELMQSLQSKTQKTFPSMKGYRKYLGFAAMLAFVILLGVSGIFRANNRMDSSQLKSANSLAQDESLESTQDETTSGTQSKQKSIDLYGVDGGISDETEALLDQPEKDSAVAESTEPADSSIALEESRQTSTEEAKDTEETEGTEKSEDTADMDTNIQPHMNESPKVDSNTIDNQSKSSSNSASHWFQSAIKILLIIFASSIFALFIYRIIRR